MYHGALLIAYRLAETRGRLALLTTPGGSMRSLLQVAVMFTLVVIGWVIFRAGSVSEITDLISQLFDPNWQISELGIIARFVYLLPLLAIQAFQYRSNNLNVVLTMNPVYVAGLYVALIFGMFVFAVTDASAFIYFQF